MRSVWHVDFCRAYSPTRSDVINYVTVPTLGNAIDFGNLGAANGGTAGFSIALVVG